jgi:hypothetical protein
MEPKDILPKLSSRGDVGAAALGFATGFAVDVFLFPGGVPPGTTASVFAVGAAGLKNSVQAFIQTRKSRKSSEARKEHLRAAAEALERFVTEQSYPEWVIEIKSSRALWDKEVLEDSDFEDILETIKRRLRKKHLERYNSASEAVT